MTLSLETPINTTRNPILWKVPSVHTYWYTICAVVELLLILLHKRKTIYWWHVPISCRCCRIWGSLVLPAETRNTLELWPKPSTFRAGCHDGSWSTWASLVLPPETRNTLDCWPKPSTHRAGCHDGNCSTWTSLVLPPETRNTVDRWPTVSLLFLH